MVLDTKLYDDIKILKLDSWEVRMACRIITTEHPDLDHALFMVETFSEHVEEQVGVSVI